MDSLTQTTDHALAAGTLLGMYRAAHGHAMAADELAKLTTSLRALGIDADSDDIDHLWIMAGAALQRAERDRLEHLTMDRMMLEILIRQLTHVVDARHIIGNVPAVMLDNDLANAGLNDADRESLIASLGQLGIDHTTQTIDQIRGQLNKVERHFYNTLSAADQNIRRMFAHGITNIPNDNTPGQH